MKSDLEVVREVFLLINVPELTSAISGDVCQFYRPDNSKMHDVVVGALGVNNNWMQEGTLNVKNHVPNHPDGQPDLEALDVSTEILLRLLDSQNRSEFRTAINTIYPPRKDDDGTWFNRIVVDYYSLQKVFKNI